MTKPDKVFKIKKVSSNILFTAHIKVMFLLISSYKVLMGNKSKLFASFTVKDE